MNKCSECFAEGYHNIGCSRKYAKVSITTRNLKGTAIAERFPDTPLLDTEIEIELKAAVSYVDLEKLTEEIQAVIDKYSI